VTASDLDAFLGETHPRLIAELQALHNGDLACAVELEHTSVPVDGVPVEPYTLRVTQVYRREDGEWKIVHRHGDAPPVDQSLPGEASTG
jgi:ketosteroid isomerase-like protein